MNEPKYKSCDRFTVMDTVRCEIVRVIPGNETSEPAYIFQLFDNPLFKSVLTESELTNVLKADGNNKTA